MGKNRRNFNANKTSPRFPKRGPNAQRNVGPKNRVNRISFDNKVKHLNVLNNLREIDIGITEYITQAEGFTATIKTRFSDFHVNEIDLDGNVIKLTDLTVPYDLKIEDEDKKENGEKTNEELETKLTKENGVPSEQMEEIKKIFATGDLQSAVEINVTQLSKEQRTSIHKIINQMFNGVIITTTQTKGDDRFIKCIKFNKNVKHDKREKWPWPAEYTYFVLHKKNIDTMKAASILASYLRCHQSTIVYAGTKDRRAKTSQLVCMRKRNPEAIINAAKRNPLLEVGNFHFKPDTLKLGNLTGNRFRIALRNVTVNEDIVNKALSSLKTNGFINYFGLQRFGNSAKIPTYDIGKALIKADWKLACELIMKPREHEPDFMKKMRTHWWENRDAAAALGMLRRGTRIIEAKILEGLVLFGKNDYFTALGGLSRNMRLLYIHSYQSLIWNKVVSRRIKEWGLELREGDLVYADKTKMNLNRYGNNTVLEDLSDLNEEEDSEEDKGDEDIKKETDLENDDEEMSKYKALAKPLTKEDIKSGKYTIHDLVLPLPGFDILYPNNETEKWYVELLAEDGLTFESFKQKVKLYSLPGDYRPVIIKPEQVKWHLVEYKSPTETLILSDLEELQGKTLEDVNAPEPPNPDAIKTDKITEQSKNANEKSPETEVKTEPAADEPPQGGKAIILEFNLPSSCYATMVLREFLKIDTSVENQIKLSNEADGTKRKLETGDEKTNAEDAKKIKSE